MSEVADAPFFIIGGTAASCSLDCGGKNCGHVYLEDPGEWPGQANSDSTLGEFIKAVTEHVRVCPCTRKKHCGCLTT